MTIWVMKEYNVAESWVKLCTVLAPTEGKPVCLTDRAGRVVVAYQRWDTTHTRATLAKYNAHGKVVGDGDFDELSIFSGDSCLITFQNSESLIWPKYLDVDNGTVPVQARVMWRKYLDVNKVTVPVGARVENSKSLMWPKYLDVNKVTLPVRAPVKEEEEKSSKHATSMVILLIALFAGLLILAVLE
ncbi:hypothetical protein M5689_023685 [Euphorbia peplus]|nr:hypothetical protein M5689_023685 [Euphorbia peplus]